MHLLWVWDMGLGPEEEDTTCAPQNPAGLWFSFLRSGTSFVKQDPAHETGTYRLRPTEMHSPCSVTITYMRERPGAECALMKSSIERQCVCSVTITTITRILVGHSFQGGQHAVRDAGCSPLYLNVGPKGHQPHREECCPG